MQRSREEEIRTPATSAWGRAVHALLSHRADVASHVAETLATDPELGIAHCLRGYALCFLGRRALLPDARAALSEAQASFEARGATTRERGLTAGLDALSRRDSERAAHELAGVLAEDPRDVLALKLDHAVRFMRGDSAGMRRHAERAVHALAPDDASYGYALGMLAFAREETGDLDGSERAAREALERAGDDAWGAHALAHVHLMRDRPAEGRRWLERCHSRGTFDACGNFAGHVGWHLALFCVELGDHARALELYERILEHPAGDFREVSNASSLLYRLEDAGVAVGDRWRSLAERALPYAHDHGYAFADAHYALTLARAGRRAEARALFSSMRAALDADRSPDARAARELGLPLVEGILALEDGRARDASALLACTRDGAPALGGSHAQRDLFRRLGIRAALTAADRELAERALAEYLHTRPASPWAAALASPS